MFETQSGLASQCQRAMAMFVIKESAGVQQAFTKQCLDQALEATFGGRCQRIDQGFEADVAGLKLRSGKCFAPAFQ